ncbi:MAG: FliM/FliN family flagellar motor switch protein [Plesiomonas sp.]
MSDKTELNFDDMGLDGQNFDVLFNEQEPGIHPSNEPAKPKELRPLSFFHKLPVQLTLEVASTEIPLGELMQLCEGAVVQLDKLSNQPLDVRVNGTLIGSAEVVLVDGHYGLRMLELNGDANWSTLV